MTQLYARDGDEVYFKWTACKTKRETPNHWLYPGLDYCESGHAAVTFHEKASNSFECELLGLS